MPTKKRAKSAQKSDRLVVRRSEARRILVLTPTGTITDSNFMLLVNAVNQIIDGRPRHIIMDLGRTMLGRLDLGYLDSVWVTSHGGASGVNKRFVLCRVPERIHRRLVTTSMDKMISFFPTVKEAATDIYKHQRAANSKRPS